jgi:hypothetical protein
MARGCAMAKKKPAEAGFGAAKSLIYKAFAA